jgi:tetratricopeptide (TPR) repeat protein
VFALVFRGKEEWNRILKIDYIKVNLEAERLIYSAGALVRENKPGEAAALLQDCMIRFPDEGKAYALMGYICNSFFHEPLAAEEYFRKAMILAADFSGTYIYYADALLSQERYTEMTAILNKSLESTGAPKDDIYFLFGQMNERQSKYEDAVDYYQRAVIATLDDVKLSNFKKAIDRCIDKQKTYSTRLT